MNVPEIDKDAGAKSSEQGDKYIPFGRPYSKLRRELSDDDMNSPAVQKLLLGEIDRLESKVLDLEIFQKRFYEIDKEKAVLSEKLKVSIRHEVLYGFGLAIGSGMLSIASMIHAQKYMYIAVGLGLILIIGSILSKVIGR